MDIFLISLFTIMMVVVISIITDLDLITSVLFLAIILMFFAIFADAFAPRIYPVQWEKEIIADITIQSNDQKKFVMVPVLDKKQNLTEYIKINIDNAEFLSSNIKNNTIVFSEEKFKYKWMDKWFPKLSFQKKYKIYNSKPEDINDLI